MSNRQQYEEEVRSFLLTEFLPGEDPGLLVSDTALITGGILDSIGILRVVMFLEDKFTVSIEQSEVTIANFDSIVRIAELLEEKLR